MEIFLKIIIIAGFILTTAASVWLLIVAFRESLLHGLLMLFIGGIYAFIFTILYWEDAKKPFLLAILGGSICIASVCFAPFLMAKQMSPCESADMSSPAPSSSFKAKVARAIAAGIAAKRKSGSARNPQTASPESEVKPAWNAEELMSRILTSSTNGGDKVKAASSNDWNQARALLRVGGVMKTGHQLFATVNQQVVKVNDHVAVELNGRQYRFKVRKINFHLNTVQFDPIEP